MNAISRRRVISSSRVASSSDTGGRTISSSLNFDLYHRLFRKASRATASLGFSILAMIALNLLTRKLSSKNFEIKSSDISSWIDATEYSGISIAQIGLVILDEKGVRCVSLITLSISGIELIAWLNVEFACQECEVCLVLESFERFAVQKVSRIDRNPISWNRMG
ncbi:unnamed protein product [Microthlaspi erraticum]|uniref:Uncharacterized protein n=1 Tax=Microthlaspi erraticum TaxID=1685480 RepID=A0A6D2JM76_9BRAS|nr:unnamed protein product [Microthlaspi erraticum]